MTADAIVRARIDTDTKQKAAFALDSMGLSISDAIRLLMTRIAEEQRLPFDIKVPNSIVVPVAPQPRSYGPRPIDAAEDLFRDLEYRRI